MRKPKLCSYRQRYDIPGATWYVDCNKPALGSEFCPEHASTVGMLISTGQTFDFGFRSTDPLVLEKPWRQVKIKI